MQWPVLIAVNLHVLSTIAWAGATFFLARTSAAEIQRFILPEIGAAIVGAGSGYWLWMLIHEGPFGTAERVLAAGGIAALLALLVQIITGTPVLRRKAMAPDGLSNTIKAAALGQRIAAGLLAFTALTMASARFL
jgi:hypothetical protein